jgi:serine/threonine protein kinase
MKDMSTSKPIETTEMQDLRLRHSKRKQKKTPTNSEEASFIKAVTTEKRTKVEAENPLSFDDTLKTSLADRPTTLTGDLNFAGKTITPPEVSLENIPETIIMDMKTANDAATRKIGFGGFGDVTYAVVGETEESIAKYNKKKQKTKKHEDTQISPPLSVSRLLVKKTPKTRQDDFDVSENVLFFEHVSSIIKEDEKNKEVGTESKLLFINPAIVTVFKGVELTDLCVPDKESDKKTKPLSYLEKTCIARQIIDGVASLHDKGIAHKDLKLANVLISAQGITYIIDNAGITIGKPQDYKSPHELSAKTLVYCPPEVINNNENSIYDRQGKKLSTLAHDSWSLGVMLYEIFTEKKASWFVKKTPKSKLILDYGVLLDKINKDVCLNHKIPTEIKEVIIGLLQYSPKIRLTPREALTYDVFNNDIYKKSVFSLNVEHDKNYKQLILLEKKLEDLKEINDPIESNRIRQQIGITKTRLREINVLINNEVYNDIPKDIEFECKPLSKDVVCFAKIAKFNKLIAKYKVEKKTILDGIQIHKSKLEQDIYDINNFGHEATEKKATLIHAKIDEFKDLEHQEFLSIESIDEYISQLKLEKQRLEGQNSGSNDNRSL